uniref:J domain-containing protein n=1 Tax=Strigamia maritima TaxID=126957 RepID=T1J975_STRMM
MLLLRPLVDHIAKNLRWYSKNHYEILKVNRNATTQEIKDSFVKLSKELHPDKRPNDPSSHSNFVELNEAYRVLSKFKSRQMYDNELDRHFTRSRPEQPQQSVDDDVLSWQDDLMREFYEQYKRRQYEDQRFYGRGSQKDPIPEVQKNRIKHDTTRSQRNIILWFASACFTFYIKFMDPHF